MNTIFPADIIASAKSSHAKWGIFASVTLAQWALESDYGKAEPLGSNNPFGIKAVVGQGYVTSWTHETIHGVYQKLPQHFAKYSSVADAFDEHARLLATSGYYNKARHAGNPNGFANDLTGIYATGIPGHPYGGQLIDIMRDFDLYQYD